VLSDDLCSFLLPRWALSCFPIMIAVPRVARDVFCPLRYSPACCNKAAWIRGSPFLEVQRSWFLTLHRRCICSPSARQCTPCTRGLFSRFTPLDPPCSVSTASHLVGCNYLLLMDGLVCREVSGLCHKLHYCTPGLVRTSAGSTPYKGANSPIPIEPLLLLLLLLLL
jgi:hypothetical protein